MGQYIGYARVSTSDQDLSLQTREFRAVGCETIFSYKVSGTKSQRTELDDCLKTVRAGDARSGNSQTSLTIREDEI